MTEVSQAAKEAYFTASQGQLIWARFKRQRAAMVAGVVLVTLMLLGLFADFVGPYNPTIAGANKDYTNGAPQIPRFCDEQGCSARPFIYGVKRERSMATNFRWVTTVDTEDRRYVQWFVKGDELQVVRCHASIAISSVSMKARSISSAPTTPARTSSRAPSTPSRHRWRLAPWAS